jgi:hypothetical protein
MTTQQRPSTCSGCGEILDPDFAGLCLSCGTQAGGNTDQGQVLAAAGTQYRLLPPEICPFCGEEMESFADGTCFSCGNDSPARTEQVPRIIELILVTLPLLEDEPGIQQYAASAPQQYGAILALTSAIADAGLRIRDTYANQDVRHSGLRYLSADDIWMLDLTLDVMYMLAGAGVRMHDLDQITRMLREIDEATHDHHWKRALRQAGAGPAQFQQLRAQVPPREPGRVHRSSR